MKNSSTLPTLTNKYFNSLRDENDEPVSTYNDEIPGWFVKQCKKEGRCSAVNQCYKFINSEEVFTIISKD